ncbi:MAG: N(4)-(beta-N-acetylglucosaminyl)-L-asparaginase [Ignavibacteria bacterium]|nr:N(4)-(beta-N-acetylglucosaminyl)-L-asparaginase [Ignavibacteria bacterium]
MSTSTTRREFLGHIATTGLAAALFPHRVVAARTPPAVGPVVVSSANGVNAVTKAMELIRAGSDALDAVIAGVNIVENDPEDMSVGYGGLPNEDGVVELDSAVMHGPTHRAGAVASLRNIKNPSKVARLVMERTDHVLLVGEGALRFARAHGFREEDLLTDKARERWLRWKETLSPEDDWLPPHDRGTPDIGARLTLSPRETGTIHCSALDGNGGLSCVTTTSGLEFKIPGRVGDSPIIGAGLYVDNEVGSAGSTGRGEANLVNCSCFMIVEFMRAGKSPEEACLLMCERIARHTTMRRLQNDDGKPNFNVRFYAINKKGEFGGGAMYSGSDFVVHDGTSVRTLPLPFLYKRRE